MLYWLLQNSLLASLKKSRNNLKGIRKGRAMAGEKNNLQDIFLNHIRKNKVSVTVFLVNGVKLQGVVTWFDNFSMLLRRDAYTQLVYKHAISTIMPATPIQLLEHEPVADKDAEPESTDA